MKLPDELERLAAVLERKAAIADAEAIDFRATPGHEEDAQKAENKATAGRHYADVCRKAATQLKVKERKAAFVSPSWEEVRDEAAERFPSWDQDDVRSWWAHFETNGWLVAGKTRMRDWHLALENGFKRWKAKNPGQVVERQIQSRDKDPEGWRMFLTTGGHKFQPFRFAPDWLKTDYLRSRKGK